MEQHLEITHLDNGGLRLVGELDLHSAKQLNEAGANIDGNGPTKLDLSELIFIDSSGMHAIVECARAQNGSGPLVLEGVSAWMRRTFEITNVAQHPNLEIR